MQQKRGKEDTEIETGDHGMIMVIRRALTWQELEGWKTNLLPDIVNNAAKELAEEMRHKGIDYINRAAFVVTMEARIEDEA